MSTAASTTIDRSLAAPPNGAQSSQQLAVREQSPVAFTSPGAVEMYGKIADPMKYAIDTGKFWAAATSSPLDQGPIIALTCYALRMTHIDYIRTFHTIQGKPTKRADAMLAEFRMKWGGNWRVIQATPEACEIEFTDARGEVYRCKMTAEEALASRWPWNNPKDHAKGRKDNWLTPEDMENQLFARCTSKWLKRIQPEIVAGFMTPEEATDIIDVEPASVRVVNERPTASQIIAAANANRAAATAQATGDVATEGAAVDGGPASEVVDAEFESAAAVGAGQATEQAPASPEAARDLAASAAETAAAEAADPTPGTITAPQRKEIEALLVELNATPEVKDKMLAKRGVNSLRSLSKEQAVEVLTKLRDGARTQRAAAGANSGN